MVDSWLPLLGEQNYKCCSGEDYKNTSNKSYWFQIIYHAYDLF